MSDNKTNGEKKLSTEAYKGVRDFYPEDQFIQNYIFDKMRQTAESFGYQEYGASILEPAELYKNKSSEEIVNEQTYTFTDRGDREVTLRPEMTPTLARMIAAKKRELSFPIRWYSIPNLFRYEKPQKGRLREHWQLNVDLFGLAGLEAEVEIISLASNLMRSFGLKDNNFEIRLNSRKVMNCIFTDLMDLSPELTQKISRLIDKKDKMPKEDFDLAIKELIPQKSDELLVLLNSKNLEEFISKLPKGQEITERIEEVKTLISRLEKLGVTNTVFDQTLMRGFDYYTGIVFEIYDTNPENRRAIFGGGRYDDLLAIFGGEKIPAFGFGMGDVTTQDVLKTYGLMPAYQSKTKLYICLLNSEHQEYAGDIAQKLRESGVNVIVDLGTKKVGDQIKLADKQKIPFIICLGEDERKSGEFKLKNLKTGEEKTVTEDTLVENLNA